MCDSRDMINTPSDACSSVAGGISGLLGDTSRLCWYVVHARSRHEFKVMNRLSSAGVESFLPLVERLSRWKDRKRLVKFPLFPGYLFVHISDNYQERLGILKTKGVVKLLCGTTGAPEPVPEEQVVCLMRLTENRADLDPYPYLTEGQRVRIIKGALAGIEGVLVERRGRHMLVLSVDVLMQSAALTIAASDIEAV